MQWKAQVKNSNETKQKKLTNTGLGPSTVGLWAIEATAELW